MLPPGNAKGIAACSSSCDRLPAAVTALSLNSAAYLAEIDRGQWEASQSMGMSWVQTMRYVIFPQAFRRMLPPLGNEFITTIEDTSLVAIKCYFLKKKIYWVI